MPEIYILSLSKNKSTYHPEEVQGTPFESEAALLAYLQQNPTLAKRYVPAVYKIEDTQQNVDAVVDLLV